jgi:hypothetical protein
MATTAPVGITTAPATTTRLTTSTTRRHRTTSTFAPAPSVTPFDASSERRADTQRTNKILIGIFSVVGVVVLALVVFQLVRCYKRRRKVNSVPLPPPRKSSMSQYRQSRAVSMYDDYPTPDFSRPPSVFMRKDHSFGSGSALAATPSVHSNSASVELLGADDAKKSPDSSGRIARESLSDNSINGQAMAPNDEETGRRLSPLGSRSHSPSTLTPPRPASQAQLRPRPESRNRQTRPNSVASMSRHSFLNTPSWQNGSQRHSSYGAPNRNSLYVAGAPHAPHVRERAGLIMPQPLAPELFNYALGGRHDMGLNFMQGAWGSHGNLGKEGSNQDLAPPRRARTESWVTRGALGYSIGVIGPE